MLRNLFLFLDCTLLPRGYQIVRVHVLRGMSQKPTQKFINALDTMRLEVPLAPSVAAPLVVIVLDVLVIWMIDVASVQVAACLIACEIYDRQNTVQISDVWF